jgi:PAS domain S-box-containing protein
MNIYSKILLAVLLLMTVSLLGLSFIFYRITHESLWRISHELIHLKLADALDVTSENLGVLQRFGLDKIPANVKKAQDESAQILSNIRFGKSGHIFVVTPQGVVLAHPDPGLIGHRITGRPWYVNSKENDIDHIEFTWPDEPRIGCASRFEPWNWHVVCSQSQAEVLEPVNRLQTITLWASLGIVILTSAILRFIIRGIAGPISKLTRASAAMARGEEVEELKTGSTDEIGRLTTTFIQMRDAIREQFAKIRESEEKHRRLVENLGREYFFYAHDTDGIFFYVSPSITEMLGYDQDEFKVHYATYLTDNPINHDAAMRSEECIKGKKQPPYPIEIVHKSGELRWLEVTESPIFNPDGKVTAVEGLAHDVTQRKQGEEELHLLRNYLSNIIDSMPSVLVGVDAHGRVTQWNKTAERTTGVPAHAAQGKDLSHVFPQMALEMKKITESVRTKATKQEQKRTRRSGNGTRYEDITIYPLMANDLEGAVIRIDDVTDKVRMEEMMIQSEKMLSVGGLAAGMAHEINNPLAGMMQTAWVMANRLDGKMNIPANIKAAQQAGTSVEAIGKYMETRGILRMITNIIESGQRVAEIVDNMLSFARKSDASLSPHDMVALLDKTLELATTDYDLKKHYDFKRIEIRKEYEEDLPPVPCEGAKIQQVLLNILRNGAQAMQEADTVNPLFIIRAYFETERKRVCMEIEDNGPGITEATRKRVFEPFYTTKAVGLGTGLGLSVSYFIITENHGGEMAVESQPGSGTKFIIHLPLEGRQA